MKPKKSKLNFGPNGLKGFLIEHVEKIVLGVVLVVVVGFVYAGSSVETFPSSETPARLQEVVSQATQNMNNPTTWEKVKKGLVPPSIENPIVIRTKADDFAIAEMDPRIIPSRTKRRDPVLYPPVQPEVEAMVAAVAIVPGMDEIAPLDQKIIEAQERLTDALAPTPQPPTAKKKKKGRDEYDLFESASSSYGAMQQVRMLDDDLREELTRLGTRPSNLAIAKSRNIVAVKMLIPFKKQLKEYEDALKGNPIYVHEERDIPKYVYWYVERADVTNNPNADPATLKWEMLSTRLAQNLPFSPDGPWESIPEEVIDPLAVARPEPLAGGGESVLLTLPVPPVLLADIKKLAGHSEISWAETIERAQQQGADVAGVETPMVEGPEGPDMEGPDSLGPVPGAPTSREGYRGSPSGSYRAAPGRGGYGGYDGAGGAREVTYKLFRYIDMNVEVGRKYRYRVKLALEDPNHPKLPVMAAWTSNFGDPSGGNTIDPLPTSLHADVEQRLRELARQEKAGSRKWYRETEWSEPTAVVEVPDPRLFVGGPVTAGREMPVGNVKITVDDPKGKLLVVDWDLEYAANVVAEEEVTRGSLLNFTKDAEALHPIKLEYVELKDHHFRTGGLIVDLKGGEKLAGREAATAPGSMAVIDPQGRLVVHSEASDLKHWHRFGKIEPKKVEEATPEETSSERGYRELAPTPRSRRN